MDLAELKIYEEVVRRFMAKPYNQSLEQALKSAQLPNWALLPINRRITHIEVWYKIYWRVKDEKMLTDYLAALKDCGYTCDLVEVPVK